MTKLTSQNHHQRNDITKQHRNDIITELTSPNQHYRTNIEMMSQNWQRTVSCFTESTGSIMLFHRPDIFVTLIV